MMKLPHRFIWGQLTRHPSKFGVQRCLHQTTVTGQYATGKPSPPPKAPLKKGVKKFKEIKIPVPWGHISAKWWGRQDVQPVVMVPGWQDNAGTYDRLVPLLDLPSMLAIELPGHGLSSHYSLGQCANLVDALTNLRRVVKYFGFGRVSLIGHSMGSMVSFGYTGMFPDECDKYVGLDCVRGFLKAGTTYLVATSDVRQNVEAHLVYERKLRKSGSRLWYTHDEIVETYRKGAHGSVGREGSRVMMIRGSMKQVDGELYTVRRDARLRALAWSGVSAEWVEATTKLASCDSLNIRARDSYTNQPKAVEIYEKSMDYLKHNVRVFGYHVVSGTHHVHLNNPERVAPLINAFFAVEDFQTIF